MLAICIHKASKTVVLMLNREKNVSTHLFKNYAKHKTYATSKCRKSKRHNKIWKITKCIRFRQQDIVNLISFLKSKNSSELACDGFFPLDGFLTDFDANKCIQSLRRVEEGLKLIDVSSALIPH